MESILIKGHFTSKLHCSRTLKEDKPLDVTRWITWVEDLSVISTKEHGLCEFRIRKMSITVNINVSTSGRGKV